MGNAPTVHRVVVFLMTLISTRLKTVRAGKLQWKWELDSNFKSQIRQDSIHWMTGVVRRCGCFPERMNIPRIILWWRSIVQVHCILQWSVWCMLSALKTRTLNKSGTMDDSEFKAVDGLEVVGIESCQWTTCCGNTKAECPRHWSWVDRGQATNTESPGGEILLTGCFRSIEGSSMVASMFFVSLGDTEVRNDVSG